MLHKSNQHTHAHTSVITTKYSRIFFRACTYKYQLLPRWPHVMWGRSPPPKKKLAAVTGCKIPPFSLGAATNTVLEGWICQPLQFATRVGNLPLPHAVEGRPPSDPQSEFFFFIYLFYKREFYLGWHFGKTVLRDSIVLGNSYKRIIPPFTWMHIIVLVHFYIQKNQDSHKNKTTNGRIIKWLKWKYLNIH